MIRPIIFEEQWSIITKDVVPYILPYYYISTYGRIYSALSKRLLTPTIDKDGYVQILLHLENGSGYNRNQITLRMNRLVLATFNPVPEWQNLEANHKDSVRSNNYLYNLEWVTSKENTIHGLSLGYKMIHDIEGVNNPMCKLTESQVYEIAEKIKSHNYNFSEIAKMYNVSNSTVADIAHKKRWKHLDLNLKDEDVVISKLFSLEDIHKICNFFENHDINNTLLYPSVISNFRDCFFELNFWEKYDLDKCRKTLYKILYKQSAKYSTIYNQYNYKFIR